MNNPATLNFFCILFIIIGLFSAFTGLRRIREARARGQYIKWYSQINVLLGIEYVLLALVFLTSTSIRSKSFPGSLSNIIGPLYLVLIASSAVLAAIVIRQAILNVRRPVRRTPEQAASSSEKSSTTGAVERELTSQQRAAMAEHRRERRQKAAAARRRRAGKA